MAELFFGEESAELRDTVKKLVTQNNQIVLNLGGVSYIDSGGLGTWSLYIRRLTNVGGAIKPVQPDETRRRSLQVTSF